MNFWLNTDGKPILDSAGRMIVCDTCPCVSGPGNCDGCDEVYCLASASYLVRAYTPNTDCTGAFSESISNLVVPVNLERDSACTYTDGVNSAELYDAVAAYSFYVDVEITYNPTESRWEMSWWDGGEMGPLFKVGGNCPEGTYIREECLEGDPVDSTYRLLTATVVQGHCSLLCCYDLTCHDLLSNNVTGHTLGAWTKLTPRVFPDPDTPPSPGLWRDRSAAGSCVRFLCASVDYDSIGDTWTVTSTALCGPTVNNLDLQALVTNYLATYGHEDILRETRCLLFKIEFWAWCDEFVKPDTSWPTQFVVQPDDTKYQVSYATIEKNP